MVPESLSSFCHKMRLFATTDMYASQMVVIGLEVNDRSYSYAKMSDLSE